MTDNNSADRKRSFEQQCWILTGSGMLGSHCLSDISQQGAKLVDPSAADLPDRFELYFTRDGKVGRSCEVVWRSKGEIGISFLGRSPPLPSRLLAGEGVAAEAVADKDDSNIVEI